MKKIISYVVLRSFIESINKNKVLVGGCFDLIHYGHFVFLQKAKKEGDYLIIALETDQFIKEKKKRDPIHTQEQRAKILAAFPFIDLVIKLPYFKSYRDYENLVRIIKPSVIAVTKGDPQLINKKKQAKLIDAKVKIVVSNINNLSSKSIINNFDI